jgi:hypothetical protein
MPPLPATEPSAGEGILGTGGAQLGGVQALYATRQPLLTDGPGWIWLTLLMALVRRSRSATLPDHLARKILAQDQPHRGLTGVRRRIPVPPFLHDPPTGVEHALRV